ncbi:MAG: cobalamin-dependent protein [bacterium]
MRKAKVLLIEPLEDKFFQGGDLPDNKLGLYALEKLAGELEAHDISTKVVGMRDKTIEQMVEIAVRLDPILIGFSALTLNFWLVKELAEKIKEKLPRVKIVLGGYHISTVPGDITKSAAFDYGVLGYGEALLRKLAERLLEGCENVDDIAGLIIRDSFASGGFRKTEKAILPAQKKFAWAKRNWVAIRKARCNGLFYPAPVHQAGGVAQISSGHGCIYNCSFCGTAAMEKTAYGNICGRERVAYRNADDVAAELKMLRSRGTRVGFLTTATFNDSATRLEELCEAIIKAGTHSELPEDHPDHIRNSIHLYAYVKVGLSKWQAELMAKAGFTVLAVGVESASFETVRGFNKPYSDFCQVIEHMQNWDSVGGINRALFIFPTPADDMRSKKELIARLKQALPDCIRIAHLCPSFGTPEGDQMRAEGMVLSDDYNLYDHNHQLVKTPNFSVEEVEAARQEVYAKYYMSPEYREHVIEKLKRFPWLKESFSSFFATLYRQKGIDLRGGF